MDWSYVVSYILKSIDRNWKLIALFFAGVIIAILLRKSPVTQDPVIRYVYDTAIVEVPVEVPVPREVIKYNTVHVTDYDTIYEYITEYIPADIDTAAILASYFATVVYKDTLKDDKIEVYLDEDISQNRIIRRDFSYRWKAPTEIHKKYNNYIYLGLTGYNSNGYNAYANLTYSGKKWSGSIGYDPLNNRYFVGAGIKIVNWEGK